VNKWAHLHSGVAVEAGAVVAAGSLGPCSWWRKRGVDRAARGRSAAITTRVDIAQPSIQHLHGAAGWLRI
jgi:hypothetical protein